MATPDSVIEVRQTLVPLGIAIEQFGNAPVGDHSTFELTAVGLDQSGTLDDWFAPGQFFELGNDDKLEGPEFELMRSGIQFGGGAPIAGEDVGVDTGYKPYIIDPEFPEEETFLGYTSVVYDLTGVSKTAHTQSGFTAVQTELGGDNLTEVHRRRRWRGDRHQHDDVVGGLHGQHRAQRPPHRTRNGD